MAAMTCIVGLCSVPARSEAPPGVTSKVSAEVVDLTNVERTQNGHAPLRANLRLMRAAQLQAEQMVRAGQLAHVLPSAAYPRSVDRLAAVDYRWQAYGENVALGQSSVAEVVDSWMHSRSHRTNILNPDFTELGAGYALDETGRPYYVQIFARPRS